MKKLIVLIAWFFLITVIKTSAQEILQFPKRAMEKTGQQYQKLAQHISGNNDKILRHAARFERRMYRRLKRKDPALAERLFSLSTDSLQHLRNDCTRNNTGNNNHGAYYPRLDTLKNAIRFLENNYSVQTANHPEIKNTMARVQSLEKELAQSEQIKQYLYERKEILNQKLSAIDGYDKQLKQYRQHLDGYMMGIQEWKAILNNPQKIEEKALALVKKIPAFQKMMEEQGALAQLFGNAGNSNTGTAALTGLQTRADVMNRLQTTLSAAGPNAQAILQQQMNRAQEQLARLKQQDISSGNASEMPGYGAKKMKYKSMLQRLQPGADLQFSKSNRFFPATADVALQLAYRFSEKGTVGIGTSYKIGFGTGFNNIRFTAQGLGIRSFADFKLKGDFFINGGFEQNQYQPGNAILLPQQGNRAFWASSALLGISKKFNVGKRLRASAMLLYDFLYQQTPGAQPLKYRMGYFFR
jgi:hypothetical protein